MDLQLAGKTVVVTGPAKGMGAAISIAFAREGANLALLGRDISAIEPVAAEVHALGSRVAIHTCDVTDPEAVDLAVQQVLASYSNRIDVLVNVAGGTGPIGKTGIETSAEEFDEIVHLNMRGPFNLIRAIAPGMKRARSGKIINIGGTFGLRGRAMRLAYSSSKWGLRGLTKSFAIELGPYNINVNLVAPGMVDGPRFRDKVVPQVASQYSITEQAAVQMHESDYALGRISTDKDIANATLFLASETSRQITGIDLPVDGGWAAL